jgi:hypothetical protein
MLAVLEGFLQARHPSARSWEEPEGVFHLRLSDELRRDIQAATAPGELWVERSRRGVYSFCFDGERAYTHPEVDLINVSHPFLKAAVGAVSKQLEAAHARAARGVLALPPGEDQEIADGTYFVLVFSHAVEGIRARRVLEPIAWSEERKQVLPAEAGERLLHLIQERGLEWDAARPSPPLPQETWERMEAEARGRNRALRESEKRENEARYVRRKGMLDAEFEHDRRAKAARLKTAEDRGRTRVIEPMKGQLRKAEATFRTRLEELERLRETRCSLSESIAACLVAVVRLSQ